MKQYRMDLFSKDFKVDNAHLECENWPELYYDYITAEKSVVTVPLRPEIYRGDFAIVYENDRKIYEGYVSNYEYTSDNETTVTLMPLLYLCSNEIYIDIRPFNNRLETAEQLITRCIRMLYASNDSEMDIPGLTFQNENQYATYGEFTTVKAEAKNGTPVFSEQTNRIYNLLDIVIYMFKKYGLIVNMSLDPNNKKFYVKYNYVNDYKINRIRASYSDIYQYSWNNANDSDKPNKITYYNENSYKAADAISYLKGKVRSNTDFDKDYKSSILSNINTLISACNLSDDGEMSAEVTAVNENTTTTTTNNSHSYTVESDGKTVETSEDTEVSTDANGKKTTTNNKSVTTTWTKLSPLAPDINEHSFTRTTTEKWGSESKQIAQSKVTSDYSKTMTLTEEYGDDLVTKTNETFESDVTYTSTEWHQGTKNTDTATTNYKYTTIRAGENQGNWTQQKTFTTSSTNPASSNSQSTVTSYNKRKNETTNDKATADNNTPDPETTNNWTTDQEQTLEEITYVPSQLGEQSNKQLAIELNRYWDLTAPDWDKASPDAGEPRQATSADWFSGSYHRLIDNYTKAQVTSVSYKKTLKRNTQARTNHGKNGSTVTTWTFSCSTERTPDTGYAISYSTEKSISADETTTDKVTHESTNSAGKKVTTVTETKVQTTKETNLDDSGSTGTKGDWSSKEVTTTTVTTTVEGASGSAVNTHSETINLSYKANTGVITQTEDYVSPITDPYADTSEYTRTVTDEQQDAPIVDEVNGTTTNRTTSYEVVNDRNGVTVSYSKTVKTTVSSDNSTQGTVKTISRKRVDKISTQNGKITSQSSQLTETTETTSSTEKTTTTTDTTLDAEGQLGTVSDDIQPYTYPTDPNIAYTKTIKKSWQTTITKTGEQTSDSSTTKYSYNPDVKKTTVTDTDDEEDQGTLTLHIWQNIQGQEYQKKWDWNEWLNMVEAKAEALDVSVIYYYHPDSGVLGGGTVDTDGTTNRVRPVYSSTKVVAPKDEEKDEDGFVTTAAKTFKEVAYDDAYDEMYNDRYDDYLVLNVNKDTTLFTVENIGSLYQIKIDNNLYNTILTGYQLIDEKQIQLIFGMQRQSLTQRLREMKKQIEGR